MIAHHEASRAADKSPTQNLLTPENLTSLTPFAKVRGQIVANVTEL
jgi:hypothetical protein